MQPFEELPDCSPKRLHCFAFSIYKPHYFSTLGSSRFLLWSEYSARYRPVTSLRWICAGPNQGKDQLKGKSKEFYWFPRHHPHGENESNILVFLQDWHSALRAVPSLFLSSHLRGAFISQPTPESLHQKWELFSLAFLSPRSSQRKEPHYYPLNCFTLHGSRILIKTRNCENC